jgi:hypothetical protein
MIKKVLPCLQSQACLTDAASTCKSHQTMLGEQVENFSLLFFATDKGGKLQG